MIGPLWLKCPCYCGHSIGNPHTAVAWQLNARMISLSGASIDCYINVGLPAGESIPGPSEVKASPLTSRPKELGDRFALNLVVFLPLLRICLSVCIYIVGTQFPLS